MSGTDDKRIMITEDALGKKMVIVPQIIFKGKRSINWGEVEKYLKRYVGCIIELAETKEIIHIGTEFPNEYTGSEYTQRQKKKSFGKVKANLVQVLPMLVHLASNRRHSENKKEKHTLRAKYGWYRYDVKFAFPLVNDQDVVQEFYVYSATLIVNQAWNKKLYLYDIQNIKKETNLPA